MRALRRVRAFFAFPSEFYNGFANSPTPFILNKEEERERIVFQSANIWHA